MQILKLPIDSARCIATTTVKSQVLATALDPKLEKLIENDEIKVNTTKINSFCLIYFL